MQRITKYSIPRLAHLCVCFVIIMTIGPAAYNSILHNAIINAVDIDCNLMGHNQTHCYSTGQCLDAMCDVFLDAQPDLLAIQILDVIKICPNKFSVFTPFFDAFVVLGSFNFLLIVANTIYLKYRYLETCYHITAILCYVIACYVSINTSGVNIPVIVAMAFYLTLYTIGGVRYICRMHYKWQTVRY